ncbi:MAG: hypothetical protein HY721_16940 [Planctomycetes bacterium]|nr:hypothetical protein [Planctomycetota bacterium]
MGRDDSLRGGARRWTARALLVLLLGAVAALGYLSLSLPARDVLVANGVEHRLRFRPVSEEEREKLPWGQEIAFPIRGWQQLPTAVRGDPSSDRRVVHRVLRGIWGQELLVAKVSFETLEAAPGTRVLGYVTGAFAGDRSSPDSADTYTPAFTTVGHLHSPPQLVQRNEGRLRKGPADGFWDLELTFRRRHPLCGAQEARAVVHLGPETATEPLLRGVEIQ